jgi:kexin
MYLWSLLTATLLLPLPVFSASYAKRSYQSHNYYVLEHHPYAPLDELTSLLGVELVEPLRNLPDFWLVRAEKPPVNARSDSPGSDPVLARYNYLRSNHLSQRSQKLALVDSIKYLSPQTPRQRVKRAPPPIRPSPFESASQVAERLAIADPLFPEQWHLVNEEFPENTMNVTGVWEMGFTGKGVLSSLIDDGLDYTSDDLAENFVRTLDSVLPNATDIGFQGRFRLTRLQRPYRLTHSQTLR